MPFFWSEVGPGFGELGSTPPPRIPKSTPWASSSKSSVIRNLKVDSGWGGGGGVGGGILKVEDHLSFKSIAVL